MYLLQVAVASDAYRVRRPVPPPDAPAVRRLSHARRSHWAISDGRKLAANKLQQRDEKHQTKGGLNITDRITGF